IVLGGAVGAMPALIGWAAIDGAIGYPAIALGLVVFLWTPAHFYNLALVHQADYRRGGFPMLPVVRGERVTLRHIAYYLGATLLAVGGLAAVGTLGWPYVFTGIVFAGLFLTAVVHLYRHQTPRAALVTFHTSNLFLGVVMVVIVLETMLL
ncbi:MAG: protoheme IX farnesyltransferase, partial [Halobacteriota archaeon]